MSDGQIVTFYSYKGGVGRTMALVNVAVLEAQRGKRVLVVDLDLEAPGLHRYLLSDKTPLGGRRYDKSKHQLGVINGFHEINHRIRAKYPDPGEELDGAEVEAETKAIVEMVLGSPRYGYEVTVGSPSGREAALTFLRAGRFDDDYSRLVRSFDWEALYEDFPEAYAAVRAYFRARYDIVLIDARTGICDIESVATVLLPDKLVVVFSPNDQSLSGALDIGDDSVALQREREVIDGPLALFPLLSRVEGAEPGLKMDWVSDAAAQFTKLFAEAYGARDVDLSGYFERVQVPHSSYYAYGEKIAVEMEPSTMAGTLAEAYERFRDCLAHPTILDWLVAHGRGDRALLVALDGSLSVPPWLDVEEVIVVPEEPLDGGPTLLRDAPLDVLLWERALAAIEHGIVRATRGLRGALHLFVAAPYAAAVLLGQRLNALARTTPLVTYQWSEGRFQLFSAPRERTIPPEARRFFESARSETRGGRGVILAVEGVSRIQRDSVERLAARVNARFVHSLTPRSKEPLRAMAEIQGAIAELRAALDAVQSEAPGEPIYWVTTAPVALSVELGRMVSPTAVPSLLVCHYDAARGHLPVLDAMTGKMAAEEAALDPS